MDSYFWDTTLATEKQNGRDPRRAHQGGRSNMLLDPEIFKKDLSQALDTFDAREADRLVGQLIEQIHGGASEAGYEEAGAALDLLRRKRRFDLMDSLASAWRAVGVADPKVQRQHAQALIDQKGRLLPALGTLTVLRAEISDQLSREPGDDERGALECEDAEARGLIGRTYKQLYVDDEGPAKARPAYLRAGIDAYLDVYESDPGKPIWHGINVVALLCRAQRDGVSLDGYPDPLPVAEEILGRIEGMADRGPWEAATAMEACIALDRPVDAATWLSQYLHDFEADDDMFAYADAFELGSTLRQLEEVWNLQSDSSPGSLLLMHLKAALLGKQGGSLEMAPKEVRAARKESGFEKNFGLARFRTPKWLRMGLSRAECVAQISNPAGDGFGTGFVLAGHELHERFSGTVVLVTNSHVISADDDVHGEMEPLWPEEAHIAFEVREDDTDWVGTEVLWESAPDDLDCAIVELSNPVPIDDPYPVNQRPLATGGTERIYVVGHPKGGSLKYPFDDNHLLEMDDGTLTTDR